MRKIIFDVDTGVDDAVGLVLALCNEDIQVLAITCVAGNTSLKNACRNTARVLQEYGKKIPIYRGAAAPLLSSADINPEEFNVQGKDGLGDVDWSDEVDTSLIQSEHAVHALIRLVKENPGEITLITTGPLTNIALALSIDRDFRHHMEGIHIMGGNTDGVDVKHRKEFNFGNDPEAADIVLKHLSGKITLISRDVADKYIFTMEWTRVLLKNDTSNFLHRILEYRFSEKFFTNIRLPDFMLVCAFVDPDVVIESVFAHASMDLCDPYRSMLELDYDNEPNIKFYKDLSFHKLKEHFVKLFVKSNK